MVLARGRTSRRPTAGTRRCRCRRRRRSRPGTGMSVESPKKVGAWPATYQAPTDGRNTARSVRRRRRSPRAPGCRRRVRGTRWPGRRRTRCRRGTRRGRCDRRRRSRRARGCRRRSRGSRSTGPGRTTPRCGTPSGRCHRHRRSRRPAVCRLGRGLSSSWSGKARGRGPPAPDDVDAPAAAEVRSDYLRRPRGHPGSRRPRTGSRCRSARLR